MNQPATPTSQALYESAAKIYPRLAQGRYARLRVASMFALLGLYYLLPWLSWNGQPLVMFDLPARRFQVLWLTLFPQDLFLLTWLLLCAALTLFLFTTLAGRVWCGFACPQTVWTEAFIWMERLIEGDRHQRQKLDAAPWSLHKLLVKGAKHTAWLVFAAWTGLTFVGFFVPIRELFVDLWHLQIGGWPAFWSAFYAFATWGNAGFMREQVCKYMCPYARFQSAMFDRDTLIVAYDEQRGEPRKSAARLQRTDAGDCIDCTLCVQVCPTGIDIRQGLQYECIACAACVDACNTVMDHIDKPRGLIRYTSVRRETEGRFHILRPRMLGYAAVWLALLAVFAMMVFSRSLVDVEVLRDRRQLYRELPDGTVANVYTLKVENKDRMAHRFRIDAELERGGELRLSAHEVEVGASQIVPITLTAIAPKDASTGTQDIEFTVQATDQPELSRERESRFFGVAP